MPGDVELAVPGVEPAAMDARVEIAGQGHDGPLRLAVDLVAEDQEMRSPLRRRSGSTGP